MHSASHARFMRAAPLALICSILACGSALAAPHSILRQLVSKDVNQPPPTDEFCRENFGLPCYSPQEMRTAYGMNGLINSGMVGAGQTIIIIDSYGSPTIAADLAAFDAGFGIPDPPSFTVLSPLGSVPWDPTLYFDQPVWAAETTLDVEWALAMAPGAAIMLIPCRERCARSSAACAEYPTSRTTPIATTRFLYI